MTFFEFILPALSVGIFSLVNYRAYSEAFPIRLTRAMLLSFITAVVYVTMGYVGIVVATSLRFRNSDLPDLYNQLNTVATLREDALNLAPHLAMTYNCTLHNILSFA
mgnify:CR=1 FL=1